jgi:hypothetical protein
VNSVGMDWSKTGLMVDDMQGELGSFSQWRMTFVRKGGNCGAHALSK